MNRPWLAWMNPNAPVLDLGKLKDVTTGHFWVLAALVTVVARALVAPIPLADFWWHLKAGEIIFSTGVIPHTDLFTFTAANQTFVHQNWLAEVAYYLLYLLGGLPLIVVVNAAVIGLALIVILDLAVSVSNNLRLAGLSGLLLAVQTPPFLTIRPATFSIVLFAIFLWVVERYRRGQKSWLWALPPLMVLWVNLHGAFILGPALLVLILACETIQRVIHPGATNSMSWSQLKVLGIITLLVLVATMVNPEGVGIYDYVRSVQMDVTSQSTVQEWQVPNIRTTVCWPFFLALGIGLLAFIYTPRRPRLAELLLYVAFAAFALTAVRNLIWFGLVSTPILARQLAGFQKTCGSDRSSTAVRTMGHGWTNVILAGLILSVPVLMLPWVRAGLSFIPQQTGLEDARTPVGAVRFIEEEGLQGRIFHPQIYGDYLDWRLGTRRQVFVDTRVHMYGQQLFDDYHLLLGGYELDRLLTQYGIQLILLDRMDSRQARLREAIASSAEWELVYTDSNTLLFQIQNSILASSQRENAGG